MKEMVGGCCVCSDDRGWAENPLVYCDGQGCTVAVHQACYGIVTVPTGNWYCRKCESPERAVKRCELCPSKDGALKPTDNNEWAHVVCALYIPEVRFGNVTTMEPIILQQIPQERFNKSCYICEEGGKGSRAGIGACMQCNKAGCRQHFHVTCAQGLGLLCEEAGNYLDNVKYCGYCHYHYTKLKKGGNVKTIPPYRPVGNESPTDSPSHHDSKITKRKLSTSSKGSRAEEAGSGKEEDTQAPTAEQDPPKAFVKKRKGGKTPPRASPDPGSSPRPVTPGKPTPPQTSSPPTGSKPGSIVVQVPLEAAMGTTPAPPHPASPPSADQPTDHPVKRARSQSSDKSEKGRRSKRGGGKVRGNQSTPPPSQTPPVHSAPLPSVSLKALSPVEESGDNSAAHKTRKTAVKEEKDHKILQNGVTGAPHMLGNQLNTSSTMAQKMCDTLSQEVAAHSIFTTEPNLSSASSLVGPQIPKSSSSSTSNNNRIWNNNGGVTWNSSIPQSLDQLLERQWEQGSQFLMEQAQHFDIASLLSCLHQLRAENAQLEEHVNSLLARRDHLLAVNARLAIPLVPPQVSSGGGTPASNVERASRPVVENGLASPTEQQYLNQRNSTTRSGGTSGSGSGSCYVTAPSSVVVRATDSALHRRSGSCSVAGTPALVYPTTVYSSPGQPSTSQQPQVVMRRDESQQQGGPPKPS